MKTWIKLVLLLVGFFVLFIVGSVTCNACNSNQRARNMGGTMTIDVPEGTKVVSVEWKDDVNGSSLWYLVRPMRPGEKSETLEYREESRLGVLEGKVILHEHEAD